MDALSLKDLGEEQLSTARSAHSGRAAHTVYGGHEHTLRQTLISLAAGNGLDDHESPGQATLLVLRGRVRLGTAEDSVEGGEGDFLAIPPQRHNLAALEDSVVLLTVVAH